jgi:hypothetical protein
MLFHSDYIGILTPLHFLGDHFLFDETIDELPIHLHHPFLSCFPSLPTQRAGNGRIALALRLLRSLYNVCIDSSPSCLLLDLLLITAEAQLVVMIEVLVAEPVPTMAAIE